MPKSSFLRRSFSVPAFHQIVVLVDQLVVLVPERLPGPAVVVGQLHVEGLAPALQRVAVILGVLPEPADQVASTIASFGLFIATQAFRHAASRSRLNPRDKYR
jgi:hypothetical protein